MYEVLLISLVMETYFNITFRLSTIVNGGQFKKRGKCVQYNHMFSDTEHNKIMNNNIWLNYETKNVVNEMNGNDEWVN